MQALVLDDEKRYRDHVKRHLESKTGLDVQVAANVEEAQQLVRERPVDVMVIDIKLPHTMDGIDFAAWTRDQDLDPAIIFITGYGSPEHERRSRALGAVGYLEKPFDVNQLELYVRRAMDQRKLLRELHRLEQELAHARAGQVLNQAVAGIPLICLNNSGEVVYATPPGQKYVDALVDPGHVIKPAERIDGELLECLQAGVNPRDWGQVTLFKRDGSMGDCRAMVHPVSGSSEVSLLVLFMDARGPGMQQIDDLWLGILLDASQRLRA